jgi:hypothetical protein
MRQTGHPQDIWLAKLLGPCLSYSLMVRCHNLRDPKLFPCSSKAVLNHMYTIQAIFIAANRGCMKIISKDHWNKINL